jgi:hypothetical protein
LGERYKKHYLKTKEHYTNKGERIKMNILNCKDYGVKKSWDGWRSYAYVSDGTSMGLMPITWASEAFKTKQQAKAFIDDLAIKNGWKK